MSSASFARILPGSLCITLLRNEPRNAGRIVQVLAHEGSMPELGISDGYCIEAVDQDRLLILFDFDENGHEVSVPDGPIACVDRKYLRLLTPPSEVAREHVDIALTMIKDIVKAECAVAELHN